ncbi:receptor-like protein 35 [Coffea eugenioides]|uniref:receptor-like protein 35 n=1 Tax=Coffea eugenioides TaxID=49369 RepID=UPI000F6073A7|nr:receptor-like protein 35 [Coffea eugenioides]
MERACYYFPVGLLVATSLLAVGTGDIITDKSDLVAFKNHIVLDPHSIVAKNWSISSSVCDWIGVTCDFGRQRVVALNISNMGFAGTIPPQLGNLSFLVSVDMSNNNFYGHLPKGMSHLRRLSFMALGNNILTGEIPSWLGVLDRLQYLSLRENNFVGHLPANICDNLPNLKKLDLYWNQLSGQLLSGLSNCSGLKSLDLSLNQFNGYIPKAVGNLKMLEELHLYYNNLEGDLLKRNSESTHESSNTVLCHPQSSKSPHWNLLILQNNNYLFIVILTLFGHSCSASP